MNAKDEEGQTPLYAAARWGQTNIAALLISNGADVNAKDVGGYTPLDYAVIKKQNETTDLLRKHDGKTGAELKAEGK